MPRRSILITLSEDDDSVSSNIRFMQRLEELRARYPSWHIRGIVHRDERPSFVPHKPHAPAPAGQLEHEEVHPIEHVPAPPVDQEDLEGSLHSADSDGNVVGHHPKDVSVGLRVQLQEAPYNGREGIVAEVREGRFRVELKGRTDERASSWWCTPDEVITLPYSSNGDGFTNEAAVPVNSLAYIAVLKSRIEELEQLLRQ